MEKPLRPLIKYAPKSSDENKKVHFKVPESNLRRAKRPKTVVPTIKKVVRKRKENTSTASCEAISSILKCEEVLTQVELSFEELHAESCAKTAEIADAIDKITDLALNIVDADLQLKPIVENDVIELERTVDRMDFPSFHKIDKEIEAFNEIEAFANKAKANAQSLTEKFKRDDDDLGEELAKAEKMLAEFYETAKKLLDEI